MDFFVVSISHYHNAMVYTLTMKCYLIMHKYIR